MSLEPTANNDGDVANISDKDNPTMDVDNYADEITSMDNDGRSDEGPCSAWRRKRWTCWNNARA